MKLSTPFKHSLTNILNNFPDTKILVNTSTNTITVNNISTGSTETYTKEDG
ncbi:11398_t:CDS:1, partial [Entrophospora sp. SA101]